MTLLLCIFKGAEKASNLTTLGHSSGRSGYSIDVTLIPFVTEANGGG